MTSLRTLFLGGAVALLSMLFALPLQARGWCDDRDDESDSNLRVAVFTDGYLHAAVFADGYLRSGGLSDCEDEGDEDGAQDGTDELPEIVVTAPSEPEPESDWVETVVDIVLDAVTNYLDFKHSAPIAFEAPGSHVFEEEECTGNIIDTRPLIFEGLFNPYDSAEVTDMGGESWQISDGYGTEACINAE